MTESSSSAQVPAVHGREVESITLDHQAPAQVS